MVQSWLDSKINGSSTAQVAATRFTAVAGWLLMLLRMQQLSLQEGSALLLLLQGYAHRPPVLPLSAIVAVTWLLSAAGKL